MTSATPRRRPWIIWCLACAALTAGGGWMRVGGSVEAQGPTAGQSSDAATAPGANRITGQASTRAMIDDARLNDVQFVDPQNGWAVGDRGVIWTTNDGGANWRLQPSGVDCTLSSITFLDQQTGWIAGGTYDPFAKTTSAIVLWTRDGGANWRREDSTRLLPFARQIKFFNREQGWLRTDSSAMFPSGLFHTKDGGRSWSPVVAAGGWRAADFLDPANGALAGMHGAVAGIRRENVRAAAPIAVGLREVHGMQLVPGGGGWLVGDGGLVMLTATGGNDWQFPAQKIEGKLAELFDFFALDVHGTEAWIAGSPGSCLFHTPDAGHTWHVVPTGQSLPLRSISFVDPAHGWAVGELGTILATADGGRTWQTQHRGGTRAAALGLFSSGNHVPWEAFAQLAGQEGYLAVAHALGRRDMNAGPAQFREDFDRIHEAMLRVGGASATSDWQFPLTQEGLARESRHVLEHWDDANDGRGLPALQERLVRLIRTWRPELLLTGEKGNPDDPAAELIAQIVSQAVVVAADPKRFPEHAEAGLGPWQVKKVIGALRPGSRGEINLDTAAFAPRLEGSLADFAQASYAVSDPLTFNPAGPKSWGFRLLTNQTGSENATRDLMAGIILQPGGDARRTLLEIAENTTALQMATRKFRNAQAILEQSEQSPELQARLMGQVGDLTAGLEGSLAGRVLFNLAASYHRKGQSAMAAQTYEALIKRYPEHPLTPAAGVWLVQYYTSAETGLRTQKLEATGSYSGATTLAIDPTKPGDRVINTASATENQGKELHVIDLREKNARAGEAIEVGKLLESINPALVSEPRVQFPLAAAYTSQGLAGSADRFFFGVLQNSVETGWRDCAAAEQWLAQKEGPPPKPLARCGKAFEKPYLDGLADDPLWRDAAKLTLRAPGQPEQNTGAEARAATDGEFLYLFVRCNKVSGVTYAEDTNTRTRDADLADHDRVEFLIDIDRDYATYYRLVVDDRGWTADACFGDESWNPTWYVAPGSDETSWTAEIAIPLGQLTPTFVPGSTVWALGVQRVTPGVGLQSWTQPASTSIQPEGFGLLSFPE